VPRKAKPPPTAPNQTSGIVADSVRMFLHEKQRDFSDCTKIYRGFVAGVGCVAAETLVGGAPIADLGRQAVVQTLFGDAPACAVGSRGRSELYRVRTLGGREVVVTLAHQFLTPVGWRRLRDLGVGATIASCGNEAGNAWDAIDSIEFSKGGEFYDLHVPFHNHYAANGLWHHNSGKSWVGAYDLLRKAQPGALYSIVAPSYRMLEDATLRTFIELATNVNLWNPDAFFKADMKAKLWNNVEILFRSGDSPNSLRGPTLAGAWLDECQKMSEEVFGVMIGRLRYGGKQGWLSGTFTPSGKDHWTYRVFGDETNPNVGLFHCSTKDNPFLEPAYYANLLAQYGKGPGGQLRALQELEGKFVCIEGSEWPPDWFGDDLWFDEWPSTKDSQRVVTLDSSKGKGGKSGDDSVFCMMMYHDGLLWVDFDADNIRTSSDMASRAVEIQKLFKPHAFGVESEFGGDVLADDIGQRAEVQEVLMPLMAIPTHNVSKDERIRRLTPYLQRRLIRFKNTTDSRRGVAQLEAWPHSEHDDFPDALEMAVRLMNESGLAG
jgi:phage terminase large subunit-like protein